jgi:hypothetical protein
MLLSLATLALHASCVIYATLLFDDFQLLTGSFTWGLTWQHLWQPHNEHVMPLGRLSTWLLVQVAGRPTALPILAALQGPLAVLGAMGLVYVFVHRERGNPWYGLLAMAFFGLSTQYREAVRWFSASFAILAMNTLLLALLAAQHWRQTGKVTYLAGSALFAGLAPCWFAGGLLAGPMCSLYLLGPEAADEKSRSTSKCRWGWLLAFVPLIGTIFFAIIALSGNVHHIMHLEHWDGKTATEAFHPLTGMVYSLRSLVDNLLLGTLGISGVNCPPVLVAVGLLFFGIAVFFGWQRAPDRRLLVLGLGMILLSYLLIYSARSEWPYDQVSRWSRYQLMPHMGLVLFVCGCLPRWDPTRQAEQIEGKVRWAPFLITGLFVALFLLQLARARECSQLKGDHEQQGQELRRIEEMDHRCRENHIDAATARLVLEPFLLATGGTTNAWELLRGSNDPRPLPVEEARRLLSPSDTIAKPAP